jgi:hypothetical protein
MVNVNKPPIMNNNQELCRIIKKNGKYDKSRNSNHVFQ